MSEGKLYWFSIEFYDRIYRKYGLVQKICTRVVIGWFPGKASELFVNVWY